jgi:hypothetical protein
MSQLCDGRTRRPGQHLFLKPGERLYGKYWKARLSSIAVNFLTSSIVRKSRNSWETFPGTSSVMPGGHSGYGKDSVPVRARRTPASSMSSRTSYASAPRQEGGSPSSSMATRMGTDTLPAVEESVPA